MSADQWEEFIAEWIDGFGDEYKHVQRLGGSGDMGRDVVAYLGDPSTNCPWDSFQCKHYAKKLSPNDIWVELGKLCVYTFEGEYTIPRRYRFVAPKDVSTKLFDLLRKPDELRKGLIKNWANNCETEISEAKSYPCVGALRDYIERFDFSIVGHEPVMQIIRQHSRTSHHARRFDLETPKRPANQLPPNEIDKAIEMVYIEQLLEAYADHLNVEIAGISDSKLNEKLRRHLARAREYFYSAETLNRFSRDNIEEGAFDDFKKQIHDGVINTVEDTYEDGLERLNKTTDRATSLNITASALLQYISVADKIGACHHLANDKKITWVRGHEKRSK